MAYRIHNLLHLLKNDSFAVTGSLHSSLCVFLLFIFQFLYPNSFNHLFIITLSIVSPLPFFPSTSFLSPSAHFQSSIRWACHNPAQFFTYDFLRYTWPVKHGRQFLVHSYSLYSILYWAVPQYFSYSHHMPFYNLL